MINKLSQFFKKLGKIGLETNSSVMFDMSKLLLEYDTVLGGHVLLEEDQKISNEGKKLIRSRTKSELDYYFELLRIYYVNYKNSKKTFLKNNINLKQDCMKFIKDNDIKVSYSDNRNNQSSGRGQGMGTGSKRGAAFGQREYIPKFEEDTDDDSNEEEDEQKDEKKDEKFDEKCDEKTDKKKENPSKKQQHIHKHSQQQSQKQEQPHEMLNKNKFALVLYDHTIKYKERIQKTNDVWKKMFRVISLYTHPDKTNKEVLHNLFRKVMRKYEYGDNYYLIFIIKILGIDGYLSKKYKNFMKKHKKKYESYMDELNQRISYLWNARMYYIKCPVYKYDKMNEYNKNKLVKFCLTNNMLEFNKYSKYI